jgi:methionine-rich copper-binding protein CopC
MFTARLLAGALAALMLTQTVVPAVAHAKLLSAVPKADGMAMPMPASLRLNFSEVPELAFSRVSVTGPDNQPVAAGKPGAATDDPNALVVPLPANLPEGTYTVEWTAVTDDGHKTSGTYTFEAMQ